MGTGDNSDPTTDFFDIHLAQLQVCSATMTGKLDAADFKSDSDASIALCQAAIANGRQRSDMPSVVALMPSIVTKYEALPEQRKTEIKTETEKAPAEGVK